MSGSKPLILVLGTIEECFLIDRVLEPIKDRAEILYKRYPLRDERVSSPAARQRRLAQETFLLAGCNIPEIVVGGIIGEKGETLHSSWRTAHEMQRACLLSGSAPRPWFVCTYPPGMRFGKMPPAFERALRGIATPDEDPERKVVCYVPHNELPKVIGHRLGW